MRFYKHALYAIIVMLTVTLGAQEIEPEAAFDAYACNYNPATDTVAIPSVLIGADGESVSAEEITVDVDVLTDDQTLIPDAVTFDNIDRLPMRIVLVLDITETVPLQRLLDALESQFLDVLQTDDEIALIAFGRTISPISQFYADKDRFFEEQLASLEIQQGDNRMYDALRDAVVNLPTNATRRQVVVMVTDSRPREDQNPPQVELDEIIDEAQDVDVQIFVVGYYSRDIPDEEGLQTIANATDGYAWFSRDNATIENIERGIIEQINDLVTGLNAEIRLNVDLQDIEPDANDRVLLEITVETVSDPPMTDTISCTVERITNTINFVNDEDNLVVSGEVDIAVEVDTEVIDRRIVFLQNDEIVQNTASPDYTFDATDVPPGSYIIRAELRDADNEVLGRTPDSLTIYAQQFIRLETEPTGDGGIRFRAFVDPDIALPNMFFTIADPDDPNTIYPIGDPAPFVGGRATIVLDDAIAAINDETPLTVSGGEMLQLSAFVPGETPESPLLATSNLVSFQVPQPPVVPTATPPPPPPVETEPTDTEINTRLVLFWLSVIFLMALNILLFRSIARARIRRMIRTPDDYEITEPLMTITVQHDGVRQSHRLTKKTMYVGRGSNNDINLGNDPNISRNHGVVMWRDGSWFYTNRKRRAKARIDGKTRRGLIYQRLEPITNIEIGEAHMVFHTNAQQDISEFMSTNI